MFKKFSVLILSAIILVGCSSDEKEKLNLKGYEESVAAFISGNDNIAGYGHIDVSRILTKGKLESNSMFQMFAGGEYDKLKQEVDFSHPVFFAVESPKESGESTSYFFFKLKDAQKLEDDLTGQKGFVMKDAGSIRYTEDGDMVLGLAGELGIVVVTPGDYEGDKVIKKAFKLAEGKAKKDIQNTLKTSADFVFNIDMERMVANMPESKDMPKSLLKDGSAQVKMNFEKGQLVIEGSADMSDAMKKKLGLDKSAAPLLSKKLTDATGNTLMALQMSISMKGMPGNVFETQEVEDAMQDLTAALAFVCEGLEISEMSSADHVRMPGSGNAMGNKMFEAFIDFDALSDAMPDTTYDMFLSKLDYATYEVEGTKAKLVIRTHESNENFLVTILNLANDAYMAALSGQLSI